MKMIRLSRSIVGEKEKQALSAAIDNGYLGMGDFVREFEEKLQEFIGAKRVICVNSGTAALHLALMGIGLKPGDEVLVQSLTFVACYQAISAAGAVPVSCEIDPSTCMIDLKDAGRKITSRTRAILPVHYSGRLFDMEALRAFAGKHNLRVVEDAAHAFGALHEGRNVGSYGDVVCFSFDGIKNITTGEGGAVATSDENAAQRIMDARLLGVQKDTEKRYKGQRSWEFDVTHQGYRFHMSNLFAAVGLAQLGRLDNEFKPARQAAARRYNAAFAGIKDLFLFKEDYTEIIPHIFPMRVLNGKRDELRRVMAEKGIETGIHYYPNHFLTYYGAARGTLPVTEKVYNELISIPLHPGLTDDEIAHITGTVQEFFKR